jgi:nitrous oxidase accessory protein
LRGFVIRNSGDSLDGEHSGITVEGPNAVIEDNRLEETLFGIDLIESPGTILRNNVILSKDLDVARRGDPVRVWYSDGVLLEGNIIRRGRDVVLWYSNDLTLRNNQITEGRYGLHFMYADDATLEGNLLTDNSVGVYLMYSRDLQLLNNTIANNRGPSGFGLGLKDMDDYVVEDNLLLDNRVGVYLDTSPREIDSNGRFEGNVLAYNDIGVEMLPSVQRNEFRANSFVENEQQVAIAGGSSLAENIWTAGTGADRLGNFWSDYAGYDGDGNGLGDIPYKSEKLFESLTDRDTALRIFLYSPVEQAIEFASRAAPFVKPQPKLTDEAPMMAPIIPTAVPGLPERSARPMWVVSLGLLLAGLSMLRLGSFRRLGEGIRRPRPAHEGDDGFSTAAPHSGSR